MPIHCDWFPHLRWKHHQITQKCLDTSLNKAFEQRQFEQKKKPTKFAVVENINTTKKRELLQGQIFVFAPCSVRTASRQIKWICGMSIVVGFVTNGLIVFVAQQRVGSVGWLSDCNRSSIGRSWKDTPTKRRKYREKKNNNQPVPTPNRNEIALD